MIPLFCCLLHDVVDNCFVDSWGVNPENTIAISPLSTREQAWDELGKGKGSVFNLLPQESTLQQDLNSDFSLGVWKQHLTWKSSPSRQE